MNFDQPSCATCEMWHEIDHSCLKNTPKGLMRLRIHAGICLSFFTFMPIDQVPAGVQAVPVVQCGPAYGCVHYKGKIVDLEKKADNSN